jgi:hypothetical protein
LNLYLKSGIIYSMEKREVEQVPYTLTFEGKVPADKVPELLELLGRVTTEQTVNFKVNQADTQPNEELAKSELISKSTFVEFGRARSGSKYGASHPSRTWNTLVFNYLTAVKKGQSYADEQVKAGNIVKFSIEAAKTRGWFNAPADRASLRRYINRLEEINDNYGMGVMRTKLPRNLGPQAFELMRDFSHVIDKDE